MNPGVNMNINDFLNTESDSIASINLNASTSNQSGIAGSIYVSYGANPGSKVDMKSRVLPSNPFQSGGKNKK